MNTEPIIAYCDFCEGQYRQPIKFRKVYDQWESSSWHEPLDPLTGSDWIANWCAHCGPQHRSERAYREWQQKKAEYVFQLN
jgi:hypothetical protein